MLLFARVAVMLEHYASARVGRGSQLVAGQAPSSLVVAQNLPRRPLMRLLDWTEDGSEVLAGREEAFVEGRPLAHALMRFLLERVAHGTLAERLASIALLDRAALLALEDEWHRWLDVGGCDDRGGRQPLVAGPE